MKKKDKLKEFRALTDPELKVRGREIAEEIMKLRFRRATGQLEQSHRIAELHVHIAQVKTLLQERSIRDRMAGARAGVTASVELDTPVGRDSI